MAELHVLRVFVNEDGEWGNRLGVFLEAGELGALERQRLAAELGFSETVFVEDPATGRLRIHTPTVELQFAGHPTVGAAWLLARNGAPVKALQVPAGAVAVRGEGGYTFAVARPEWAPPFDYRQLALPAEVRKLTPSEAARNTYAWAWIDEAAGTIRARAFVPEAGIAEDEATGSAALGLCARLDCPITIHQGHGSVLLAKPLGDGRCEVGGRVVLDDVREQPLAEH